MVTHRDASGQDGRQKEQNIEDQKDTGRVGMLVDSVIDLSTRNGVYQQSLSTLSNQVGINKTIINRDRLSTWLIVGKLGQGMRCCKCNSNSNVLVCETQGKVSILMYSWVRHKGKCVYV
jgi:hypothetical protein